MLVAVVGEPPGPVLRDDFVFGSRCTSPSPLFPHFPWRHMVRVIADLRPTGSAPSRQFICSGWGPAGLSVS